MTTMLSTDNNSPLPDPPGSDSSQRDVTSVSDLPSYGSLALSILLSTFLPLTDDEFASCTEYKEELQVNNDYKYHCDREMVRYHEYYKCLHCGVLKYCSDDHDTYNPNMFHNYNSFGKLKVVGSTAYHYDRNLPGADYTVVKARANQNVFNKYQYDGEGFIPKDVMRDALELFSRAQKVDGVRRGDVKQGIQAACIAIMCKKYRIARKPLEIANYINITQTQLSESEKILEKLFAEKKLDHPLQVEMDDEMSWLRDVEDCVDKYFEQLDLTPKYKPFIMELVRIADDERIGRSSINISKAAGAILVLVNHLTVSLKGKLNDLTIVLDDDDKKLLKMSKNYIAEKCDISKSTFARYSNEIEKYKQHVIKAFNLIPLGNVCQT